MDSRETLLRRIDAYLNAVPRAACDVETVGPFTLFFRRDSTLPEISYARPTAPLEGDLSAEIGQVRAAFTARGRVCRWEFLAELAPTLPAMLVQNGFPEPIPRPLMVVTRETFRPESSAVAEIRPIERMEGRAVGQALSEAYGMEFMESEEGAGDGEDAMFSGMLERGACILGAFVDGLAVAGGVHSPVGDTTEVAGIGTRPAFQRRGIGGALTSALVADAFDRGCECVFLSAADEAVQRVYARLGFAKIGSAMDTMDAPPEPQQE
jgi:ribosomal protein S18 acetylase RimI-like enzyme